MPSAKVRRTGGRETRAPLPLIGVTVQRAVVAQSWTLLYRCCIAEVHSAGDGKLRSVGPIQRSAEYNSAIRQIENLRYTPVQPRAFSTSQTNSPSALISAQHIEFLEPQGDYFPRSHPVPAGPRTSVKCASPDFFLQRVQEAFCRKIVAGAAGVNRVDLLMCSDGVGAQMAACE